jgi:hypothetical protein
MTSSDSVFLGPDAGVPLDRPFTRAEARRACVSDRQFVRWLNDGRLLSPMRNVFHSAELADGLELRLACLRLVVPDDAVVTGRTAGWLHGAPMVLAPGDHLRVPRVEMQLPPGNRLRNPLVSGGERALLDRDVVEIGGVRATSKLRTTVDLGRCLSREQAFAGMCAMSKVADFDEEDLARELQEGGRFAGYRWVRQARGLAPLVTPVHESPAECVLALAAHDQPGMPTLTPQYLVPGPSGNYRIDLAVPPLRYGAEYKGRRWHDETRADKDAARLRWLVEEQGWIIDEFEDRDVFGPRLDPGLRLRCGVERARRRVGALSWRGQNLAGEPWLG